MAGDYLFFLRAFARLRGLEETAPGLAALLMERLLGMFLLAALSMLAFSAVLTSLSTLYLSRDLELLLAGPVRTGLVFAAKYIEAAAHASYMVWLALLPALAAYGAAHDAGAAYFATLPLLALAASLPPTAAGSLVTVLLLRFFPARRAHQVLTVAGLASLSALVSLVRLLRPERLLGPLDSLDLQEAVQALALPGADLLPSTWLARGLVAAARGDTGSLGAALAGTAALGLAALALLSAAQAAFYRRGWMRSREGSGGVAMPGRRAPRQERDLPPGAALAAKDLRIFFRDPSRWSQLLLLGALVVVYLFNISSIPAPGAARGLVALINLALTGFVLSAVALRFAFTAPSLEGEAIAMIRASPVGMGRYLWTKFATLTPMLLVLALALVYGSNRLLGVDRVLMVHGLLGIAALTVGLVGMGIGMGAMWPRFRAGNPAEAATSPAALLFMVTSLAYIGAVVALLARPLARHLLLPVLADARFLPDLAPSSYLAIALLCAAATLLPMAAGIRSLSRRDL